MKKWLVSCILIFGVTYTSSDTVFAELKIPDISDTVGPLESPIGNINSRSIINKRNTIFLPENEVTDIKKIQSDYQNIFSSIPSGNKFSVNPILSNGTYSLGTFAPGYQEGVADQINFYRSLAKLKPAPYSREAMEFTQHGSIGMASVRKQTHNLVNEVKPKDMPQEFWNIATNATSSSQIHSSFKEETFTSHINGFFTDYGSGNKSTGHRTWLLGMSASELGAGYAKANGALSTETANFYTSVYTASDYPGISTKYTDDFITQWPTETYFPIQLYNQDNPYMSDYYKNSQDKTIKSKYEKNMRWSVHFNEKSYKLLDSATVTIKNNRTNIVSDIKNDGNGGEITVTNAKPGYYAVGGFSTLTFRPNNAFEIIPNDTYTVSITGILKNNSPITYSYSTRFVDMEGDYQVKPQSVTGVSVSPSSITMSIGESQQLTGKVSPDNADNKGISWTSSDDTIATVSSSGLVTGKSAGKATITAKTMDGGKVATAQVTITNPNADGFFGTVPWKWDDSTQTITFGKGEFPNTDSDHNIKSHIQENSLLKGKKIKHIVFGEPVTSKTSLKALFRSLDELETIKNLNKLDSSDVTDMSFMFASTLSLKELDLTTLKTQNVTKMNSMFLYTGSLVALDVSNWDTSNVTNMEAMFSWTSSLTTLNVSNWDTSNVTNMEAMFSSARSLTTLDVSNWDTSNVTNMSDAFKYSSSLTTLDVSDWDTSNVTNMEAMFSSARSLTTLNVSNWDTSNVTNMKAMFSGGNSLTALDLSNWDTNNVKNMNSMLEDTSKLVSLNLGKNMKFTSPYVGLPEITRFPYTGRWINKESDKIFSSSANLLTEYNGSDPGLYIRESK